MAFADPLPWWVVTGLGAVAAAAAFAACRGAPAGGVQRTVLGLLRFATLMLLLVLVMRPVARSASQADTIVPILVDTSRSMSIEDAGGSRRIDQARALVSDVLLPAFDGRFGTAVLAFGETVRVTVPEALTASARRSDLADALGEVIARYQDRPIAGIVVVSDGGFTPADHEAPDVPPGIPLFPIGVGSGRVQPDREVLGLTALDGVLDDSRIDLAVSVVSRGFGSDPFDVRLLANGRLIEVRRVRPAIDGVPLREVVQVSPDTVLPTVYTAEIAVGREDTVPENNARSVLVPPATRARRVLIVQGAPGFEHSFLRRAWRADRSLEVDAVVRQGRSDEGADTFYIQAHPARSASLAAGFPSTREELFAYDAVVLANVDRDRLEDADMEALAAFVSRRGGGLLVLGARSFLGQGLRGTPLDVLLPLDPVDRTRGVLPAASDARPPGEVALTRAGESHPITQLGTSPEETRRQWASMPALSAVAPLGAPRPGADVLAVAAGAGGRAHPLLAVQRYGDGRTAMFAGEAAWRWRMRLPADDRRYDTFWRQVIRWIARPTSDPVTLRLPDLAAQGDMLALRVVARTPLFEPLDATDAIVRVTRPDGRIDTLQATREAAGAPGTLVARYNAEDPGIYRVTAELGGEAGTGTGPVASAWLLVGGVDREMADPRLDMRALERVATASGGRVIDPGEVSSLVGYLTAATPLAIQRVQRDLWHSGWVLAVLLTLLTGEWTLRRWWGLR
jgi:uncharacterized membrane protein